MADSLTPFEGQEVTQSKIEIRNVGGGLQEALKFDPVEIHRGQRRWIALEVECDSLRFDPIKDSDCMARVHIFKPVGDQISFLNDDPKLVAAVRKHVEGAVERTKIRKEREAGILRLGESDGDGAEDGEEPFGHPVDEKQADAGEGREVDEDGRWAEGYPQGQPAEEA